MISTTNSRAGNSRSTHDLQSTDKRPDALSLGKPVPGVKMVRIVGSGTKNAKGYTITGDDQDDIGIIFPLLHASLSLQILPLYTSRI